MRTFHANKTDHQSQGAGYIEGGICQEDLRENYQNDIQNQVDQSPRIMNAGYVGAIQRVVQRKRKRQPDDEETTQAKGLAVQRVVTDEEIGKRIIIDDPRADDFGDTGTLIRKSRNVHGCLVVEFDNERGVQYRVWPREMSALNELQDQGKAPSQEF